MSKTIQKANEECPSIKEVRRWKKESQAELNTISVEPH